MRDLFRWMFGWMSSVLPAAGPASLCFHDETLTATALMTESLLVTNMTSETVSYSTLTDESLGIC